MRVKLENPVVPLHDFHLRSRLIETVAPAHGGRQSEHASVLKSDEVSVPYRHDAYHDSGDAVIPQDRITVIPCYPADGCRPLTSHAGSGEITLDFRPTKSVNSPLLLKSSSQT